MTKTQFTPSSLYRKYLGLLMKIIELPGNLPTDNHGTGVKDALVFHKMVLTDHDSTNGMFPPTLTISSYLAYTPDMVVPEGHALREVNPEYSFYHEGEFWIGNTNKVFKDYTQMVEKKYGNKMWLVTHEREGAFETFSINEDEKLFELKIPLSTLDHIVHKEETRKFVGSVEEDGTFIPAPGSVENTTVNDAPFSAPPFGATPFFAKEPAVTNSVHSVLAAMTNSIIPTRIKPRI